MNCKKCQTKLLESLAASETVAREVAMHQQSCTACATCYREQQEMFQRVNAGLRSLVNQPVPPSLLPRVRARLDETSARQSAWWPAWSFVAATVVLALGIGCALHRLHNIANSAHVASVSQHNAASQIAGDNMKTQPQPKVHVLSASKQERATADTPPTAGPQVIVSAEERLAFAKFIAHVPEDGSAALARVQPVQPQNVDPTEIALLRIVPLEVGPTEDFGAGR
jgi:ferredoxin